MAIQQINNSESGGSVRSKLNSLITAHNESFGFMDYNDSSTSAAPVSLSEGVWTDIPNDGLGAFTNKTFKPEGVNEVVDVSTGYLDFSDLPLGSEIVVRNDFVVTPSTNNCLLEARYLLGAGAGEYGLQFWSERLDSGSGTPYRFTLRADKIYMGDDNTRLNPIKLQVRLSSNAAVTNAGTVITLI